MSGRRHRRDGIRDRWAASVAASSVGNACKVLLFYLVATGRVTEHGRMTFHRETVAKELRIYPQRVTERIAEAKAARLLDHVGGGYEGRTSEYVLVIPTPSEVPAGRLPLRREVAGERLPLSGYLSGPRGTGSAVTHRVRVTNATKNEERSDEGVPAAELDVDVSPNGKRPALELSPAGTVRRCECGTADVAAGHDVCVGCFADRIAQRRKKESA